MGLSGTEQHLSIKSTSGSSGLDDQRYQLGLRQMLRLRIEREAMFGGSLLCEPSCRPRRLLADSALSTGSAGATPRKSRSRMLLIATIDAVPRRQRLGVAQPASLHRTERPSLATLGDEKTHQSLPMDWLRDYLKSVMKATPTGSLTISLTDWP